MVSARRPRRAYCGLRADVTGTMWPRRRAARGGNGLAVGSVHK